MVVTVVVAVAGLVAAALIAVIVAVESVIVGVVGSSSSRSHALAMKSRTHPFLNNFLHLASSFPLEANFCPGARAHFCAIDDASSILKKTTSLIAELG